MSEKYVVYKFTNMINGKSYIGKSKRIKIRYKEHVKGTVWRTGTKSYISKAIGKYGIENFSFEIIGEYDNPQDMNIAELNFINEYNSVVPNGYNFRYEIDDKYANHEETKKKLSIIGQGIRHAKRENIKSQYIGVNPNAYNSFVTHVRINHKIKSKTFQTEIESAEAYDRMVLFLYGENARINFEEKRLEYLAENLEDFYNKYITNSVKKHSNYTFISPTHSKRWIVSVYIPKHLKNSIPSLTLGSFAREEEAAIMADKMNFCFDIGNNYNFPEKIKEYNKEELKIFFLSKITKKTSKYEGVSIQPNGKWRSYFYVNRKQVHVGYGFLTEEDAYGARQQAIKNHQEKS